MITYHVSLEAAKDVHLPYEKIPVSFQSHNVLTDRDIKKEAMNRVSDRYTSFGWFTCKVEEEA